jgi:hypothetical protein
MSNTDIGASTADGSAEDGTGRDGTDFNTDAEASGDYCPCKHCQEPIIEDTPPESLNKLCTRYARLVGLARKAISLKQRDANVNSSRWGIGKFSRNEDEDVYLRSVRGGTRI